MLLVNIYSALETRIKASTTFSAYTFFRYKSKKAAGSQNKARVPFVSLVFEDETSQNTKKWGIQSTAVFSVEIRWETIYPDLDALGRVTEFSARKTALLRAILAPGDEEFLGLQYVSSVSINCKTAGYTKALEELTDNGLDATVTVDYFEGRE